MPYSIDDKLKTAVTSRALFQLEYENNIFEQEALLSLNELADLKHKVEVIITSRNSMNNSIRGGSFRDSALQDR
ncbi:MAG TPA: hypothetical protein VFD33_00055 [Bacillota bacterium]|nr:hypothetical protein [Bacillota bacterium]